jgi:hypothetical protein
MESVMDCGKVHIDQDWSLNVHKNFCTHQGYQRSAAAKHSIQSKYGIECDKAEDTANIQEHRPCIITEAIEIIRHPKNITVKTDTN